MQPLDCIKPYCFRTALKLTSSQSTSSGIFGIVKTTLSNTLALRADISWQIVLLYGWAGTEVFINIVCGSLSTLKPLYDRAVHKKPLRKVPGSMKVTAPTTRRRSQIRESKRITPTDNMIIIHVPFQLLRLCMREWVWIVSWNILSTKQCQHKHTGVLII
jgi:hypothetical protein